ncbi:LOW QUALITY PROTEIN: hypothetical protein V1478_017324 [Vespula squamosa]|uniref:Uncharacterized protein n=1 Tax=Vespula squamosa TaxID=30214 RepID=A0ABD1ZXN8_VESSQ
MRDRLGARGTEDSAKLPGTVSTGDDNPFDHIALIDIVFFIESETFREMVTDNISGTNREATLLNRRSRNRQFCDMPFPLPRSEQAGEED